MTEARSLFSQRALELYNDVQLCHEMGWSQADLEAADDDFVWACLNVLDLENQKAVRETEDTRRGFGPSGAKAGAVEHHRASAPPERVP